MLVPKKKDSSPEESESRHYFWLNFSAPARITYLDPTHFENVSFKNEFLPGAHHCEPATTPYSCHGVFADRSVFSLNLSRIQIPTGTSVTNCNHKHGHTNADMFTWGHIVLSLPKRAHADWNWPISGEKYLKIDWSAKMPLHRLTMGVAGSKQLLLFVPRTLQLLAVFMATGK